ncbi:type II toxin-antitoxin system PemK/MazF family toxin [Salmonella enterica]|uniref:Type II toxin-antitoxin system PemK/MazF family toxin n=2 Tax=Salmonella enterica TaxID=28901 RepID=A0A6Y5LKG9_SALDZ|nr:type II toxin-antitoxin system PemK/MazF family toxin [Salmonella enterica subsp. diarizonae]EAM7364862.1 type II toxin-antitoxin system PemK/MazF family toxin [Salmonella enterica]EBH8033067.1 type II toxin-antitoxin system PemK/MazF family toxin [Salmonella bongori]ECE8440922.1 type II toxin-antitoxin system PemK/MazF family toxin [Salmonella enterica subsp. enterica serovar Stanley]ECP8563402.1 type II toxin-antitoxin system PemK/MazF family toxin [Salmonella enterica subsp. enterica sero
MKRGDLITVAMQGDFGKPRPALVIQADSFDGLPTVSVLPVTGTLTTAPLLRVTVQPDKENGLRKASQVMIDKVITVKRDKTGDAFGRINANLMTEIERRLALFLGIVR